MELLSRFEGNTPFHDSFRDAMFATSCRFEIENTQLSRYEGRLRQRAQFALRPRAVLSRADIFDCTRAAIVLALYFNMEDCLKEASTYVAIAFGYFLELDQTKESCCICEIARECTPKERLAFQSAYIADRLIAAQLQSPGIFPEEISETFTTDYSSDLRLDNGGQICSVSSQTTTPPSTPPGVRRSPLDQFAIMELRVKCASLVWNVSQSIKLSKLVALFLLTPMLSPLTKKRQLFSFCKLKHYAALSRPSTPYLHVQLEATLIWPFWAYTRKFLPCFQDWFGVALLAQVIAWKPPVR